MRLINHTPHLAETFQARHPQDLSSIRVVIIKGSFSIPHVSGDACKPLQPLSFQHEDTFIGEPGTTAPMLEADFTLLKPRCDVVVVGHAYAPHGPTRDSVPAGIRIGGWQKVVAVSAPRRWQVGLVHTGISEAEPWAKASLGYEGAFGGTVLDPMTGAVLSTYMPNPVGTGYFENARLADQRSLPWLQEVNRPISSPSGQYPPLSLGVLPRNTSHRSAFAGNYDSKWRTERFPDLPADFDARYFQCTASDQWIDGPRGGEEVGLLNLLEPSGEAKAEHDGIRHFKLPDLQLPIHCVTRSGERQALRSALDTLIFEPDALRFSVIWRTHVKLGRDPAVLSEIEVGNRPPVSAARGHVVHIPIDRIGGRTASSRD